MTLVEDKEAEGLRKSTVGLPSYEKGQENAESSSLAFSPLPTIP